MNEAINIQRVRLVSHDISDRIKADKQHRTLVFLLADISSTKCHDQIYSPLHHRSASA